MKDQLTLKSVILGHYCDREIEEVFKELIKEGQIPNDLETSKVMEKMKRLPFYYKFWRNVQNLDEMLIES